MVDWPFYLHPFRIAMLAPVAASEWKYFLFSCIQIDTTPEKFRTPS